MEKYSLAAQQTRLENIRFAQKYAAGCYRTERVRNYLPGQVTYNLGDEPARVSAMPTEYDHRLIASLAQRGVQLIQLHEEWNDAMRLHGADKYSTPDPEGLHKFVDLCHGCGIKVIPYVSSGYLQPGDPAYRPEFSLTDASWSGSYKYYRKGSAGSAAWREFILRKTFEVMDTYGFDGIYNDWGYDGLNLAMQTARDRGEVFDRTNLPYDPEIEDLLCLLYEGIHARGGICKLHDDSTFGAYRQRVYDYLWIGEAVRDPKTLMIYRDAPLYIVPCPDKTFFNESMPRMFFALSIPFMQFPLLPHGRPWKGEGADAPGVKFNKKSSSYAHLLKIRDYTRAHPNGPYVYSHWSSIPDDPAYLDRWSMFLALYRPMVVEGSIVHICLEDTGLFRQPLPKDTLVSMFTNERQYLVISNLGDAPITAPLAHAWRNRETGETVNVIGIPAGDIRLLERIA